MKLIDADPRILNNEDFKPSIPMTAMGNSSIDFVIRAWVNSKDFFSVKYDLTEKVYNIFKEKEIEIPFPQMDIHMRN
jgi:small conductance mechanosensitive channel